ncbi:MAG: HAD-IIIA family hydrolase [Deltaproteobacteria bacterium]|nr:HAD-IIIA family hydrolase [Deltaproteobacteria bacterium]
MIKERAEQIKLLILDIDGVMTDGHIVINEQGEEIKTFHVRDGQGLKWLIKGGIEVAIISGRSSKAVERRATDLGIQTIYQGIYDKGSLCADLIREKRLKRQEVACMGDDLPDIPMFQHVGLSIAVSDAAQEVRDTAHFITKSKGGNGAVREICEMILKAKGLWDELISPFIEKGKALHIGT